MGIYLKILTTKMLPPQKESSRIGHWNPNDSLYFHKSTGVRRGYTPGWNEPLYQYRETKLEQVSRPRNNPTFYSTVLGSKSYNYPVDRMDQSVGERSETQSAWRLETTKQRQFHKKGYQDHVPQRQAPMSPTKPYSKNHY